MGKKKTAYPSCFVSTSGRSNHLMSLLVVGDVVGQIILVGCHDCLKGRRLSFRCKHSPEGDLGEKGGDLILTLKARCFVQVVSYSRLFR